MISFIRLHNLNFHNSLNVKNYSISIVVETWGIETNSLKINISVVFLSVSLRSLLIVLLCTFFLRNVGSFFIVFIYPIVWECKRGIFLQAVFCSLTVFWESETVSRIFPWSQNVLFESVVIFSYLDNIGLFFIS